MDIQPKNGILLIRRHIKGQLKADIAIEESDENKSLITGEVIANGGEEDDDISPSFAQPDYSVGTTVIFGKYALFSLVLQGEKYYFLDSKDVIGVCDYKEN